MSVLYNIPESGQLVPFTGTQSNGMAYPGGSTTVGTIDLPGGTGGLSLLVSGGFSSLTLVGYASDFTYLSLPAIAAGQVYNVNVNSSIDERVILTIVSGATQQGIAYVLAFPGILPPLPPNIARGVAFASAARVSGTYNFPVPLQTAFRGIFAYLLVPAGAGTATVAVQAQNRDLAGSSSFGTYLTSAAIGSGAGAGIRVYPGIPTVANQSDGDVIGQEVNIQVVVSAAGCTFAVEYDLLP